VSGHILELVERDADAGATSFRWGVLLLAGAPTGAQLLAALPADHAASLPGEVTYFGGATDREHLSAFANPDNLGFDREGNLWIVTDGNQPGNNNDGCFVCPTEVRARSGTPVQAVPSELRSVAEVRARTLPCSNARIPANTLRQSASLL
jgi:secreted PhoX family phosphatase